MATCYLYTGVPLDETNKQQFNFPNGNSDTQLSFFNRYYSYTILYEQQWLIPFESLRLELNIEEAEKINYLCFINKTNKYFCFVHSKQYVNERTTLFNINIDYFQTYLFDFKIRESFVVREHQNRYTGTPAWDNYNVVPENINYGTEYETINTEKVVIPELQYANTTFKKLQWYMIIATESLARLYPLTAGRTPSKPVIEGVLQPYFIYLIPYFAEPTFLKTYEIRLKDNYVSEVAGNISLSIKQLYEDPKIISISVLPYLSLDLNYIIENYDYEVDENTIEKRTRLIIERKLNDGFENVQVCKWTPSGGTGFDGNVFLLGYGWSANDRKKLLKTFSVDNFFNVVSESGYKDMNREPKLKTYPYHYFLVNDNQGSTFILKQEYVTTGINIKFTNNYSNDLKTKYHFEGYLGDTDGKTSNMINTSVRNLPLITDAWKNYEQQSRASQQAGLVVGGLSTALTIGGIALAPVTGGASLLLAGAGLTGTLSYGGKIAQHVVKENEIKNLPDSVKQNGNNLSFDLIDQNIGLTIQEKRIPYKDRLRLFNYFHNMGYACNEFKTPNINSRYYFNYIQTIGADIQPNISRSSATATEKIRNIFDNGVTIIHIRDIFNYKTNYKDFENVEVF